MQRLALALALTALLAAAPPARGQCVMCKTALTGSPEGRSMGEQFNRAILLMLVAPYVILGTFAALVLRQQRRPSRGGDLDVPPPEPPRDDG